MHLYNKSQKLHYLNCFALYRCYCCDSPPTAVHSNYRKPISSVLQIVPTEETVTTRDIVDGMTRLSARRPKNRTLISGKGRYFRFLQSAHSGYESHPASNLVGTGAPSPGLRRSGREIDHSPPPSAEVKSEWSCTSTSPTYLHGADRHNFTFTSKLSSCSLSIPTGKPTHTWRWTQSLLLSD